MSRSRHGASAERNGRPTGARPESKAAERHYIFGKIEAGKSRIAKAIARRARGTIWIWDPCGDWLGPDSDFPIPRASIVSDPLGAVARMRAGDLGEFERRVVWQVPRHDLEFFPLWCRMLARWKHRKLVVVDEAHDVGTDRELIQLVRKCRHSRSDILLIAHRPTGLHPHLRSQASRMTVFATTEPLDLAWFKKHCGPRFADLLPTLKPRQYATWNASE